MSKRLEGALCIAMGTAIWGFAFVAQSVAMEHIGPFTFIAARSIVAVAVLLIVIHIFDAVYTGETGSVAARSKEEWSRKGFWKYSILCGIALLVASSLQQIGIMYTEPGKAGFLTAMYIVMVPVIGLFLGKKANRYVWIGVALAVVGLYMLSWYGSPSVNIGDVYLIASAMAFAVQITLIDRFTKDYDGLRVNCVQFMVMFVVSAVIMVLNEQIDIQCLKDCAMPILYTGVMSSAVAYSLQIIGQKNLPPEPAALIMSLEAAFAVLAGWVVLGQGLSVSEFIGCVCMFAAVIISQMKSK